MTVDNCHEFDQVTLSGVSFRLWPATPAEVNGYAPRPEMEEWLARLLSPCYEGDAAVAVLLTGPPGVGKTLLAAAAARLLKRKFYRWGGHGALRADDLIAIGRFRSDNQGTIEPVLSPLATAALTGSMAFLDDIDKCTDECLSILLPLLDGAPTIPCTLGAAEIPVDPASRYIFACNSPERVPVFLRSRVVKVAVPFLSLAETSALVEQSGAIPNAATITAAFRAAWTSHAPRDRSASLREAMLTCRILSKEAVRRPAALQDQAFQKQLILGVLEQ